MKSHINVRNLVVALVALGLTLLPVYSALTGNIFILTLFTRIVIFALAAASLNLIMGYGGMMSLATPPISASAAMRSASLLSKASAPASSSGRSRWRRLRYMRSSLARSVCAPAASISS